MKTLFQRGLPPTAHACPTPYIHTKDGGPCMNAGSLVSVHNKGMPWSHEYVHLGSGTYKYSR